MSRKLLLASIVGIGFGFFGLPDSVAACRCAPIDMAEAAARDPSFTVFVAVPGESVGGVLPVVVKTWYLGPAVASGTVEVEGWFGESVRDCGPPPPVTGEPIIMAAYWQADTGHLALKPCTPAAAINSPEGRALMAEAEAAFGPPDENPGPAESADRGFEIPAWAPLAGLMALIAAGSGLAFFGGERRRVGS